MNFSTLLPLSLALIIALVISIFRRKEYNFSLTKSIVFTILTCIYGFVGTKILFMIEHLENGISFGGVSFYGAVFFIPIALFFTSLITKEKFFKCLDYFGPFILSTLAVMRIGCYISGCCSAHRIIFMGKQIVPPIQIIEFIFDILIFVFLVLLDHHDKNENKIYGLVYPKVMVGYGFIRLIMEHFRDTPKDVIGMSRGQWYSIVAFLIGFIFLSIYPYIVNKNKQKTLKTHEKS